MAALSIGIAFIVRLMLVLLFLPFSALDKIIDFKGVIRQCEEAAPSRAAATLLIVAGLCIEVFMSAGVLLGIADRVAAFVLAAYCVLTALLWKQFWLPGDFWMTNESQARNLFWDFWKNVALAGGFLLITFGTGAQSVEAFLADPLSSTHPYSLNRGAGE